MKKEDLIEKVAELEIQLENRVRYAERVRKEFAKAFNWYKKRGVYDSTDEVILPSWEEIFTELGKLLATKSTKELEDKINSVGSEVKYIQDAVQQIIKDEANKL